MLIISSKNFIYYGSVKNGLYHGEGNLYLPNGDYFQGTYKNGEFIKGKGRKTLKQSKIYEGELGNGMITNGIIMTPLYTYRGGINSNFQMNGQGIQTYFIEGLRRYLIKNLRSAELETFFLNHLIFRGTFLNDEIINGEGVIVFIDMSIYYGTIQNKQISGKGSMYYINGDSYSGMWKNNSYHGTGKFKSNSGNSFKGKWIEGFLQASRPNISESMNFDKTNN